MLIFAILVQKIEFEQSQFQKVSVVLPEFYFFQLPLLLVLRESCFKGPKVLLDEYFYY